MIIKKIPEDFIVQEVLIADYSPEYKGQPYMLMQLDKKGWSTMDATMYIEKWFGIKGVTSAGLKDSDGVTTQKIAVPIRDLSILSRVEDFNKDSVKENTFIHLSPIGYSDKPLEIARLEGNAFRLRLRNMDPEISREWLERKYYPLVFPNYFDKQRFGMPGYRKVTHLIGKALLKDKDYKTAYEYVLESGAKESKLPFNSDYKEFFDQVDPRVISFYNSALFSADYNSRLGDLLEAHGSVRIVEDEGIAFKMPADKKTIVRLMEEDDPLSLLGTFEECADNTSRNVYVSTVINFLEVTEDEYYPGRSVLTVSFFLPMGAYATMAMKQLEILMSK